MANNKILVRGIFCLAVVFLGLSFMVGSPKMAHAATGSFHIVKTGNETPLRGHKVEPDIAWTICNGRADWFQVYDGYGNEWCLGGGGYMSVDIYDVITIKTGNNWGHFQIQGFSRQEFSYYQNWNEYGQSLIGVWLYE